MMLRTAPPLSLIFFVCHTSLDVWIVLGRLTQLTWSTRATRYQKFEDWISQTIIFFTYTKIRIFQILQKPSAKVEVQTSWIFKKDWANFEHRPGPTLYVWCKPLTYYYIPLRAQYFNSIGLHITSLALFTQSIVLFGKNMYILTIYLIILHFQDSHIFQSFWAYLGSGQDNKAAST